MKRARLACIYQKCKDLNALCIICWIWCSTQACVVKVALEKLVLQQVDGFDHRDVIAGLNTCSCRYHRSLKAALYAECLHGLHHLQRNHINASWDAHNVWAAWRVHACNFQTFQTLCQKKCLPLTTEHTKADISTDMFMGYMLMDEGMCMPKTGVQSADFLCGANLQTGLENRCRTDFLRAHCAWA